MVNDLVLWVSSCHHVSDPSIHLALARQLGIHRCLVFRHLIIETIIGKFVRYPSVVAQPSFLQADPHGLVPNLSLEMLVVPIRLCLLHLLLESGDALVQRLVLPLLLHWALKRFFNEIIYLHLIPGLGVEKCLAVYCPHLLDIPMVFDRLAES